MDCRAGRSILAFPDVSVVGQPDRDYGDFLHIVGSDPWVCRHHLIGSRRLLWAWRLCGGSFIRAWVGGTDQWASLCRRCCGNFGLDIRIHGRSRAASGAFNDLCTQYIHPTVPEDEKPKIDMKSMSQEDMEAKRSEMFLDWVEEED